MVKLFALCAALLLATPAKAQLVKWGSAAGWSVDVDKPSRNCGLSRNFNRGTRMVISYYRPNKSFMLSLANEAWDDTIKAGAAYTLRTVLDGNPGTITFTGSAVAGKVPFIFADGLTPDFLGKFMRHNSIQFYNTTTGALVTSLSLAGSSAAMTEMLACQRAMNGEES